MFHIIYHEHEYDDSTGMAEILFSFQKNTDSNLLKKIATKEDLHRQENQKLKMFEDALCNSLINYISTYNAQKILISAEVFNVSYILIILSEHLLAIHQIEQIESIYIINYSI